MVESFTERYYKQVNIKDIVLKQYPARVPGVAVLLEEEREDVVAGDVVGVSRGPLPLHLCLFHRSAVYVHFTGRARLQELPAVKKQFNILTADIFLL